VLALVAQFAGSRFVPAQLAEDLASVVELVAVTTAWPLATPAG
jgi:hypothetical protein